MELLKGLPWRRAFLAVILNLLALSLSTTALLSSYWCTGTQKVPKPLCEKSKTSKCIGVPMSPDAGASNVSSEDVVHYSWETGDDRFAFRYFHTGMWLSCEESMEGPGSVLPRQPQLLPLYLLHRSLEMKGRRPPNTREKSLLCFPAWHQPYRLLWSLYRCPSWGCVQGEARENGCLVCPSVWKRSCEVQVVVVVAGTLQWDHPS